MFTTLSSFFSPTEILSESVPESIGLNETLGSINGNMITNYMGMQNFIPSNLTQLKMLITCWFLGEPTYYVSSGDKKKDNVQLKKVKNIENIKHLYLIQEFSGNTTIDIFVKVVNKALDEDFDEVLKLAIQGRNEFNMRSGPCAILYYSAIHPKRQEFNAKNPLKFREYAKQIIKIPTDAWMLFELWKQNTKLQNKESKKGFPTILKKVIADHIESMERYQMKKYLNKSHIIDLIRISHASSKNNELICDVVKKGDLDVQDVEQTWETLRSQQKSWKEIVETLGKLPHMALLRNLVGIAKDTNDSHYINDIIVPMLKNGVKYGKQFPFRYLSAFEEIDKLDDTFDECKKSLLNGVSDCVELAMENFPVLSGNTLCLSDNSGSAHGTFPSQYGKQTVAKISNLSGAMSAKNCTGKGYVGVFGDKLVMIEIDKNVKVLDQVEAIHNAGKSVGGGTENGMWIFFKESFEEVTKLKNEGKEICRENMTKWFDNIFIYSDMQCASGGLYGSNPSEYKEYAINDRYIDGLKLIQKYRELINPKVNVYCVQVAGHNNSLIPEILYRTHILSGWTGSENVYAKRMNESMDNLDNGIISVTI